MIYLLEADGVGLRFTVLPQVELLVQLLGQVTVTALSEQRDFGVELHSPLKNILKRDRNRTNTSSLNEKQLRVI